MNAKRRVDEEDGTSCGRFVEVPLRYSPGGGRKTTKVFPKVAAGLW